MKQYEFPVQMKVTQDELDNIVDSAVNWCNYWCDLLEYGTEPTETVEAMSQAITRGGTLVFHIDEPYEEDGETKFELTLEKLLKGIADYGEYDFDEYDGPTSDAAVQQALFGEVIYG